MRVIGIVLAKQLRELAWILVSCAGLLALFLGLAAYLYGTFGDTAMRDLTRISPQLLSGLLGGLTVGFDPLATWLATLLAHPLLLIALTAATVALASRGLAGEIDRGTMDLLLATPVARYQLVLGNLIALQIVVFLLVVIAGAAVRLGLWVGDIPPPVAIDAFGWVLVNLWALYSAVAGLCLLASALCSEQGRAIAIGVSFVVVSFFVNLIASLWSLVSWTDIASVFHYYQPHPLVRGGQAPLLHLAVLLGLAIAANAAALIAFERRDIAGP